MELCFVLWPQLPKLDSIESCFIYNPECSYGTERVKVLQRHHQASAVYVQVSRLLLFNGRKFQSKFKL